MRKIRVIGKKTTGLFLCVLLTLAALQPAALAALKAQQELETVRVGFFAFDGYHMEDEDGTRSGYGYEFLQHLAGYTDWQYEYIGYDKSWADMPDMLENGEIDILTSVQKVEERVERFDFSTAAIGTSSAILTVRAGDTKYSQEDSAKWSGMRIGMIEGNSRNDGLVEFSREKGFTYEPVYYRDVEKMAADLRTGSVLDAILTSNLRSTKGEWILAQFDPSPFYIMVKKGNTKLLGEVNEALDQLMSDEPGLSTQLMSKYYTPDSGEEIAFTAEERAFIEEMKDTTFTAAINPDREPLSSLQNGEFVGIIPDISREIISRSGLNVEFVEVDTRAEYARLVESGELDIRFDAAYNYAQAEEQGFRLTLPYLDASISRLIRKNSAPLGSVALLEDSDIALDYSEEVSSLYSRVEYFDSTAQAVNAVLSGKQDAALLYRRCAERAVQNDYTNQLETLDAYGHETSFAVGVNKRENHLLYSVLKKAVASIDESEIQSIDREYTTQAEKPFSLIGYLYSKPLQAVGFVAALFLVAGLILLAIYLSRKRKREYKEYKEEKRKRELLSAALDAAEGAGQAKSQFLSRISHEMRTPLNAIIGFMTLAKDAPPEKVDSYLDNANTAAKQLLSIINDVLDMSSIEAGKIKLSHAPFDFKHLVNSLTAICLTQCGQKGVSFETVLLTPVEEWLVGDQMRLNQILMNLLNNAIKFTTKGSIRLGISQTAAVGDKVFLRFEVADTGCGMSEEMLSRLFMPFEQESATTARKYGGSGLGLSIVKNLVALMNGEIRVESRQGEGSVFTVDLPFGRSQTEVEMLTPGGVEKLRVLVVDDESAEREYIAAVLERMGIKHSEVDGGEAALEELSAAETGDDPYNVCLVDWRMPDKNGVETTRSIRKKYGRDVVVIVVSAYEHNRADEVAREAGASMFVSKPLFQSSLFDLFASLTGGHTSVNDGRPEEYEFRGKRVLLAEDNAMNRMVATGLVERFGVECVEAEDGQTAVDKFLAAPAGYFDAILMDIQMPVMDGFLATKAIRESDHPDAKKIQIIALTANAFTEDIAKSLSGGMNAHIAKPIEPRALAEALARAFGERE